MSWSPLELLMRTYDLWDHPAQFAVMQILCWKDRERLGFAELPKREIARLLGIKPRRVHQVFQELEAMEAMTRIGPERAGGKGRYVVTIDRAVAKRLGSSFPQFQQGVQRTASPGGVQPTAWGDAVQITGGDAVQITGGMQRTAPPVATDLKTYVQTEDATSPAAPRRHAHPNLPFIDAKAAHIQERAVAEAQARRLTKLRHRVAGLARAILMNPAIGQKLLNGEVADSIDGLVEATKRLCGRKGVQGYGDVVYGQCVSELFKWRNPDVVAGTAPRPRDQRRRAQ